MARVCFSVRVFASIRCKARGLTWLPVTTARTLPLGSRTMPRGRSLTSTWTPAGVRACPFGTRMVEPSGWTPTTTSFLATKPAAAVATSSDDHSATRWEILDPIRPPFGMAQGASPIRKEGATLRQLLRDAHATYGNRPLADPGNPSASRQQIDARLPRRVLRDQRGHVGVARPALRVHHLQIVGGALAVSEHGHLQRLAGEPRRLPRGAHALVRALDRVEG